ncbi:MAG: RodZ domain-containing protein [Pontixanthobacter sp.]
MSDEIEQSANELPLEGAGQRLMRAREKAGMTIEQIAAETRIPVRHLAVIEAGDFGALPARTYAVGFSRTYAKAVGLNEIEIAEMVRGELAESNNFGSEREAKFEPGDPARIPSRGLAWFSAFALLLLLAGAFAFFRGYFVPGSGPGPLVEDSPPAATATAAKPGVDGPAAAKPDPQGEVVFTSLEDGVWVRFYTASGDRLIEKQLTKGEKYTVPANSVEPQIWTGQPEQLTVSIGGRSIGKLSQESTILRDVPVTAAALMARKKQNDAVQKAASASAGTPAAQ